MHTLKNPLIIERRKTIYDPIVLNKSGEQSGEYVDKALAQEMLDALEDYRDFLITGVSAVSSEEICELIIKAKG